MSPVYQIIEPHDFWKYNLHIFVQVIKGFYLCTKGFVLYADPVYDFKFHNLGIFRMNIYLAERDSIKERVGESTTDHF